MSTYVVRSSQSSLVLPDQHQRLGRWPWSRGGELALPKDREPRGPGASYGGGKHPSVSNLRYPVSTCEPCPLKHRPQWPRGNVGDSVDAVTVNFIAIVVLVLSPLINYLIKKLWEKVRNKGSLPETPRQVLQCPFVAPQPPPLQRRLLQHVSHTESPFRESKQWPETP